MSKVDDLLQKRLQKKDNSTKMEEMAKRTSRGHLTSFSGVFHLAELSLAERNSIKEILDRYSLHDVYNPEDFDNLISISSEVKAINNQAVLLHGERIKRAQKILMQYQEGAFSAWLITFYGNRQTPYNFLQYYEFCQKVPAKLKPQFEMMPRQAIYTLASRDAPLDVKCQLIEESSGRTKQEILQAIRELFPLKEGDQRKQKIGQQMIADIRKMISSFERRVFRLSKDEKKELSFLVEELASLIENK